VKRGWDICCVRMVGAPSCRGMQALAGGKAVAVRWLAECHQALAVLQLVCCRKAEAHTAATAVLAAAVMPCCAGLGVGGC
jgi:hypothetical protein